MKIVFVKYTITACVVIVFSAIMGRNFIKLKILRRDGDLDALGRHLLLELKDCSREVLNDLDFLKDCLRDTAEKIGATVVNECYYQFTPHGISGVVIIAESHLCIHTWPEHNYAAVDVFTCGDSIEPEQAVKPLVEKLGAKASSFVELKRGILQNNQVSCELR